MSPRYQVLWDNGANACGTFAAVFDTEQEAQAYADQWLADMAATDPEGAEGYDAEVIEIEEA